MLEFIKRFFIIGIDLENELMISDRELSKEIKLLLVLVIIKICVGKIIIVRIIRFSSDSIGN